MRVAAIIATAGRKEDLVEEETEMGEGEVAEITEETMIQGGGSKEMEIEEEIGEEAEVGLEETGEGSEKMG